MSRTEAIRIVCALLRQRIDTLPTRERMRAYEALAVLLPDPDAREEARHLAWVMRHADEMQLDLSGLFGGQAGHATRGRPWVEAAPAGLLIAAGLALAVALGAFIAGRLLVAAVACAVSLGLCAAYLIIHLITRP